MGNVRFITLGVIGKSMVPEHLRTQKDEYVIGAFVEKDDTILSEICISKEQAMLILAQKVREGLITFDHAQSLERQIMATDLLGSSITLCRIETSIDGQLIIFDTHGEGYGHCPSKWRAHFLLKHLAAQDLLPSDFVEDFKKHIDASNVPERVAMDSIIELMEHITEFDVSDLRQ